MENTENLMEKWVKDLNIHFPKDIQMVNENMKNKLKVITQGDVN